MSLVTKLKESSVGLSLSSLAAGLGVGFGACHLPDSNLEVAPGKLSTQPVSSFSTREISTNGEAFCPKVQVNQFGETIVSFSLIDSDDSDSFSSPGLRVVQHKGFLEPGLMEFLKGKADQQNSLVTAE
jgi:hypothetical protein